MTEATVTGKGQITIPVEIRRRMSLEPGDRVVFTVLSNGSTVMRAEKRSIMALAGAVKPAKGKRATLKDLGFD